MTSRELGRAVRRLADRQTDRLRETPEVLHYMQVVAVTSTGVTTVRWRGSDLVAANKNRNYTPAIGDMVLCVLVQGRITVICALDGQP